MPIINHNIVNSPIQNRINVKFRPLNHSEITSLRAWVGFMELEVAQMLYLISVAYPPGQYKEGAIKMIEYHLYSAQLEIKSARVKISELEDRKEQGKD